MNAKAFMAKLMYPIVHLSGSKLKQVKFRLAHFINMQISDSFASVIVFMEGPKPNYLSRNCINIKIFNKKPSIRDHQ